MTTNRMKQITSGMAAPTSVRIPDYIAGRIAREVEAGNFNSTSDFLIYAARFYCDLKDLEAALNDPSGYDDLESWLHHCSEIYMRSQKRV